MPHYSYSVFWSEKDEAYIAIVQGVHELRRISAWGDTPEEALRELSVALEGVRESYEADGLPMPEPELRPA